MGDAALSTYQRVLGSQHTLLSTAVKDLLWSFGQRESLFFKIFASAPVAVTVIKPP
jgi:hypothetical protein